MRTVTVTSGQNLMDIAMQEYGNPDSIVELTDMNNLEIDDDIIPGQVLQLRERDKNDEVAAYYKSQQINVSSNIMVAPVVMLGTNDEEPIGTNNNEVIGI